MSVFINKTIIIYLSLIFLFIAGGTLHGQDNKFPMEITDKTGRKIILEKKPERIISLSPGITELIFYLGLSEKLVAVTSSCDYPPEALEIPRTGDVNLNMERLMEFQPDLIVTEKSISSELVYQCDALGLPVIFLDAGNIEEIFDSILLLGKATGEVEVSRQLVNSSEEEIEKIRARVNEISTGKPVRVFVEIWSEPLMTAGKKSFINDIISIAGGENIAGEIDKNYFSVSSEWVLEKNPEVIIVTTTGDKEKVLSRSAWQNISAIENKRVYEIDPDIFVRPTPRVIIGVREVFFRLYPDLELIVRSE